MLMDLPAEFLASVFSLCQRIRVHVSRKPDKQPGFVVFFGKIFHDIVHSKRNLSQSYKPKADQLLDYATFYGILGKAYSALRKKNDKHDKELGEINSPDGIRAIMRLELERASSRSDELLKDAELRRTALEAENCTG